MKALVIGTGAVGIAIGVSLQSEGFQMAFLAHGITGQAVEANGAGRTGIFGDINIEPGVIKVYEDYESIDTTYDYVLIASKTMANSEIALKLSNNTAILGDKGIIIIFQNGWGNNDEFLKYFNKDRIYNVGITTGFERTERHISKVTVQTSPILLGSLYGGDIANIKPVADAINASGIPSDVTLTMEETLWAKMLFNTTLNPLGAILDVSYGEMAESEHARKIMNKLIEETYMVIDACGFKSFKSNACAYREEFYGKLVPNAYKHRASTLQDLEKKQKTEIDMLNGCIIRLAKEHGIKVPTHEMIYEIIKAIEDGQK